MKSAQIVIMALLGQISAIQLQQESIYNPGYYNSNIQAYRRDIWDNDPNTVSEYDNMPNHGTWSKEQRQKHFQDKKKYGNQGTFLQHQQSRIPNNHKMRQAQPRGRYTPIGDTYDHFPNEVTSQNINPPQETYNKQRRPTNMAFRARALNAHQAQANQKQNLETVLEREYKNINEYRRNRLRRPLISSTIEPEDRAYARRKDMYDGDPNTVSSYDDAANVNGDKSPYHIYGKPKPAVEPVAFGEDEVPVDGEGLEGLTKKVQKKMEEKSGAPKTEVKDTDSDVINQDLMRDAARKTFSDAIPKNTKKEYDTKKVGAEEGSIEVIDEATQVKNDAKDKKKNEKTANDIVNEAIQDENKPKKQIMPDEKDDATKMKPKPVKKKEEVKLPVQEGAFAQAQKKWKYNANRRAADSFDGDDATVDMNDHKHNDGSKTGYQGVEQPTDYERQGYEHNNTYPHYRNGKMTTRAQVGSKDTFDGDDVTVDALDFRHNYGSETGYQGVEQPSDFERQGFVHHNTYPHYHEGKMRSRVQVGSKDTFDGDDVTVDMLDGVHNFGTETGYQGVEPVTDFERQGFTHHVNYPHYHASHPNSMMHAQIGDTFDGDDFTADMDDYKHNDGSDTGYLGVEPPNDYERQGYKHDNTYAHYHKKYHKNKGSIGVHLD